MTQATSRRTFFKQGGTAALGASAAASPALLASRAADAPPNVVFIFCDQMRGDCMSGLGHPNARTPNLDRMAREGVLFDNCFMNSPVCVPSRKSVFSGRYPHEHGSLTNQGRPFLSWDDTISEHFEKRGYRTGWVGKNHTYERSELGKFDTASIRAREPFRAYNGCIPPHWHTDVYWPEEDCYPQVNSDHAIDFIRRSKDEPFFLHVSYFDPHPPYMAPADFTSRYTSANIHLPEHVPPGALSQRLEEFATAMGQDHMTRADMTETLRYYYAQIEWGVDKQVGRLMNALEQQRLAENTIVLFSSDHGDFMGTHRMVRKGMFLYDSLLHVPMIWWAPERLAKGRRTSAIAQGIDIFPTLADLSGGKPSHDLPGRSLKPFLHGGKDDDQRAVYTSAGYDDQGPEQENLTLTPDDKNAVPRHSQVMNQNMNEKYRLKMIRSQEWKFILNETHKPELYRMDGGRVEKGNVADKAEYAAVRRKLESQLSAWWAW